MIISSPYNYYQGVAVVKNSQDVPFYFPAGGFVYHQDSCSFRAQLKVFTTLSLFYLLVICKGIPI